jgi:subtilase family serine protease
MTLAAPSVADAARPAFHLAPVFLSEPDGTDQRDPMSSATQAPRRVPVDPAFAGLSTRRLTPEMLRQVRDTGMVPESALGQGGTADSLLPASTVTVYTPAQIRAAYGMFALPSTSSSVTSAQAAQMGAGQTIYLIDGSDDPNIAAELASFNSKFGLPGCTVTSIAVTASLPLPAAPTTGCTFSIVYSDVNGARTATEPAYDAGWATEIAIDVQWAHATAPYARIVLIEAPTGASTSLNAAVLLADQMGPGVVSQSFGGAEISFDVGYDGAYSTANMTYLAATGDTGAAVNWPAVSSKVLAVGGTSLTYSGSGPRTETVWSDTGGGVSAYIATPSYQTLVVPGLGAPAMRGVADVAFNADTNTGQYIAVMAQNSSTVSYWDAGGTSLATPQWAGLIAVANALRAQTSLAPIGQAQATLYGLGAQAASYASAFLDITTGSNGSCAACSAGVGYDLPTGLGTPNAAALLAVLSGATPVAAPIVTSATVPGNAGAALSFSITATGAHPLTYSLLGAPAGMTVNASSGLVTWSTPVQGSYSVTASALDSVAGLAGQGTLTVSIAAASAPQVPGGAINGIGQTPLTFTAQANGTNLEFSLSGAPSGMSVNAAGVISWASPIVGTYAVALIALDPATSLTGQGIYTVTIAAPTPPTVASASLTGTAGTAFTYCVSATATNPLTYSLTSAPSGMTIGTNGCIAWSTPMAGTFSVKIAVQDSVTALTGTGVISLTVSTPGPGIGAGNLAGAAGQALTGSIAFKDTAATTLSITVSGMPEGLGFVVNGNLLNATWTSPVTGTYSLKVTVIDTQKLTSAATIPLTITVQ